MSVDDKLDEQPLKRPRSGESESDESVEFLSRDKIFQELRGLREQADGLHKQAAETAERIDDLQHAVDGLVEQSLRSNLSLSNVPSTDFGKIQSILRFKVLARPQQETTSSPTTLPLEWDSSKEDSRENVERCDAWLRENLDLGKDLALCVTDILNEVYGVSRGFNGLLRSLRCNIIGRCL